MDTSTLEFVVVVEAKADYQTAVGIAERVLKENAPEWLAEILGSYPGSLFVWTGLESGTSHIIWSHLKDYPGENLGFKRSGPDSYDSAAAKKVVQLAYKKNIQEGRNIRAVVFIRDADNKAGVRRDSIEKILRHADDFTVVIGIANPEREAWVLNGFEAQNIQEQRLLDDIEKEIGFNPCWESHRLRGKNEPRDIKRVFEKLTGGNFEREQQCWLETPLSILGERGQNTGLSQYIDEVESYLLPVLVSS